ncbi:MAG: 50S ribosomal protein L30e [archaeon]|jgi:large subunit ribosomal protein L30e
MNWIRFNQELRNTIDTGKIIYGANQAKKECLIGDPKLIIVSSTIDKQNKELFGHYAKLLNIPMVEYPEGSVELGSVCGKPFNMAIIVIIDGGKSSIFEVINEKDSDKKEDVKVVAKRQKKEDKKTAKSEKAKSKKDADEDFSEEELSSKKTRDAKKATRGTKVKENKDKETKEEDEVPILEDKMFKDIIKIKKK